MYHVSKKHLAIPLLVFGAMLVLPGCGTAQRMTPHMGFGSLYLEAQIDREDIVVLDRVEGSSSTTSILFGLIRIIDENKLQLFGIKFFKDKYIVKKTGLLAAFSANTANRAYYKALEAHPEADAVFSKDFEREEGGLPLLFHTVTVTFKGKAIQLKADQ